MKIKTIEFKNNKLKIIDQRRLPGKLVYKNLSTIQSVWRAIRTLSIRGAPAIGVAAAYGLCIGMFKFKGSNAAAFFASMGRGIKYLQSSRPTAVNLSWAMDRLKRKAYENRKRPIHAIKQILVKEARKIQHEDEIMCKKMGQFGARLIKNNEAILTHCNAGALATAGIGTALSIVYTAKRQSKKIRVFADETRPLLQGSRLTAWELLKGGIDVTLICDSMAASLMKAGKITKIIVGADRITSSGDFANKIGTYSLACLGRAHKIPFFVVAPSSTFDFNLKNGCGIPIEQRNSLEVKSMGSCYTAPKNIKVYNPAFDVTPHKLVTAFITEKGIFRKPFVRSLRRIAYSG